MEDLQKHFGFNYQIIPPLLSILLSQCRTINDIPDKILQLRKDFKNLRDATITFEKNIYESKTIKEQVEEMNRFNEFWKAFHKKYEIKSNRILYNFWDIANESGYETSVDNVIDNDSTSDMVKDLNLGKVAGKVASKTFSWIKEKRILNRFRGITNAWELFDKRPTLQNQYKDIERVLGLTLNEKDLLRIHNYLESIKINSG